MSVWSYFKSLDVGRRVRSRLEGPTHLPKVAKGSGALSNPSKFALLSLSVADMSKLGKTGTLYGEFAHSKFAHTEDDNYFMIL